MFGQFFEISIQLQNVYPAVSMHIEHLTHKNSVLQI